MKKLIASLKKKNYFHLLAGVVLVGLVGWLAQANLVSGTWLTGWDNLHSEFNFALSFRRVFQSVWQEYQGFGLLTGMAHAADLPRLFLVWVLAQFMSLNLVRYAYHFLMLAVGSLGMYAFLASRLFPKSGVNKWGRNLACLLGAAFYLLNWGTVQYFYTPFESFSHFWAFFPWLIWSLFGVLEGKNRSRWLVFFLINFLAGAGYYVQTLFVVYALAVGLILILNFLEKRQFKSLLVGLGVGLVILGANAYWLLPSGYFALRDTDLTRESKINMMATRETFYRNQERGKLTDFLLMRGFYLDYKDWIGEETDYFMPAWRELMADERVVHLGYALVGLAVVGLWGRSRKSKYFGALWLVAGLVMMTGVPGLDSFNQWLRQSSVLDQIFRAPFTKFIVLVAFAQAGLIALGLELVFELLKKIRSAQVVVAGAVLGAMIFTIWPAFEGNLFYFNLRVDLPEKYLDLFEYFKTQDPNERIANLPQLSFWGWTNYAWGGRGSGFLWYGIEQPILDRAFDVWSDENEQYFWQMRYVYQTQDAELLAQLVEKYQLRWLLIDEDVLSANAKPVNFDSLRDLIEATDLVEERVDFDNLSVYRMKADEVVAIKSLRSVAGEFGFVWRDQIFANGGGYYLSKDPQETYLVPTLFSDRSQETLEFDLKKQEGSLVLEAGLAQAGQELILPALAADHLVPVRLWATRTSGRTKLRVEYLRPEVWVNGVRVDQNPEEFLYVATGQPLYLAVNNIDFFLLTDRGEERLVGETYLKRSGVNSFNFYALDSRQEILLSPDQFFDPSVCGPEVEGMAVGGGGNEAGELVVEAQKTANCMSAPLSFLPRKNSLFKIDYSYRSINEGVPKYCLADTRYYTCFNRKDDNRLVSSEESRAVVELAEAEEFVENGLVMTLIAEALQSEEPMGVAYSDLRLSVHPLVAQGGVSLADKEEVLGETKVRVEESGEVEVRLAQIESRYNYTQLIDRVMVGKESVVTSFLYQPQAQAYLFEVKAQNGQRLPTRAWVENHHLARGETDSYLVAKPDLASSWFVLPAISEYFDGYYFHFDNPKFAGERGENYLESISVQVLPYEYLKGIRLVSLTDLSEFEGEVEFSKKSYWQYGVEVKKAEAGQVLVLGQGFDRGWLAFVDQAWRGERLTQVEVNNWANGWLLSGDLAGRQIHLVYWPQLLQYAGFGASGLVLGGILVRGMIKSKPGTKKTVSKKDKQAKKQALKAKLNGWKKGLKAKKSQLASQKTKLTKQLKADREEARVKKAEREFEAMEAKKVGFIQSRANSLKFYTHPA